MKFTKDDCTRVTDRNISHINHLQDKLLKITEDIDKKNIPEKFYIQFNLEVFMSLHF